MNHLELQICKSPSEAPVYREGFTAVQLVKAVVVNNGTEDGNPTVDLVLLDAKGNKYVAMITGRLLKSVTQAIGGTNENLS